MSTTKPTPETLEQEILQELQDLLTGSHKFCDGQGNEWHEQYLPTLQLGSISITGSYPNSEFAILLYDSEAAGTAYGFTFRVWSSSEEPDLSTLSSPSAALNIVLAMRELVDTNTMPAPRPPENLFWTRIW